MSPVRPTVQVVGLGLEPGHHRLRDFLTRTAQPYEFFEAESPEGLALMSRARALRRKTFRSSGTARYLHRRNDRVLAQAWKISAPPSQTHYDLAIVGAGPAGLGAAVHAASDGLSTVVIEADVPGGRLLTRP